MKKISSLLIAAGIIILCGCAGTSDFSGLSMREILENALLGAIFITSGYTLKQIAASWRRPKKCKIYPFQNTQAKIVSREA